MRTEAIITAFGIMALDVSGYCMDYMGPIEVYTEDNYLDGKDITIDGLRGISIAGDNSGGVAILVATKNKLVMIDGSGTMVGESEVPSGLYELYGVNSGLVVGGGDGTCYVCDALLGCGMVFQCDNFYSVRQVIGDTLVLQSRATFRYYSYGLNGTSLGSSMEPPSKWAYGIADGAGEIEVRSENRAWTIRGAGDYQVGTNGELYVASLGRIWVYNDASVQEYFWGIPPPLMTVNDYGENYTVVYSGGVVGKNGDIFCVRLDGPQNRAVVLAWRRIQ